MKRKPTDRSRSARPMKARRALFPSRTVAIARPSVGLGLSATTVLRTSFFANVSSAGSGIYTGFLKPGSIFDPCGDIAAVQPQMYDQWALLYNRYKVNHCVIRMKITGTICGAGCYGYVACIYPAVDSTVLATYQAAASQQYAKTTSGSFISQTAGATSLGFGAEGKYLSIKVNSDGVVGHRGDAVDSGALVNADPPTLQYAVLPVFIQANAGAVCTWMIEVDMFQNVTFSQKKNVVDA